MSRVLLVVTDAPRLQSPTGPHPRKTASVVQSLATDAFTLTWATGSKSRIARRNVTLARLLSARKNPARRSSLKMFPNFRRSLQRNSPMKSLTSPVRDSFSSAVLPEPRPNSSPTERLASGPTAPRR